MVQKKNVQKYGEGDWFCVPLPEGGFAVGLIARMAPKDRSTPFGFFFGPRRVSPPSIEELSALRPEDAVAVYRFGIVDLESGRWKVLGRLPGWDRERWAMPDFIRRDVVSGSVRVITYDQNDPAVTLEEVPLLDEDLLSDLPVDGLCGSAGVARVLESRLEKPS